MPHARLPMSSAWKATVARSGRSPFTFSPAAYAMTLPSASRKATIAATVTTVGRSPSASGTSAARAAAFLASLRSARDGLGATATPPWPGLRLRRSADMRFLEPEGAGGRARIVRVADRAYDGDAVGAGGRYRCHVALVDAADGEPRLGRCVLCGIAHQFEPDGFAAGLGRGGIDGTDAEVVRGRVERGIHLLRRVGGDADDELVAH